MRTTELNPHRALPCHGRLHCACSNPGEVPAYVGAFRLITPHYGDLAPHVHGVATATVTVQSTLRGRRAAATPITVPVSDVSSGDAVPLGTQVLYLCFGSQLGPDTEDAKSIKITR